MNIQNQAEVHYEIIESILNTDNGKCTTYGIAGREVKFEDVSTDRKKVEEMITRLNCEQLEESQFMYFISDETDR